MLIVGYRAQTIAWAGFCFFNSLPSYFRRIFVSVHKINQAEFYEEKTPCHFPLSCIFVERPTCSLIAWYTYAYPSNRQAAEPWTFRQSGEYSPRLYKAGCIRGANNENSWILFTRHASPASKVKIAAPIVLAQHKRKNRQSGQRFCCSSPIGPKIAIKFH